MGGKGLGSVLSSTEVFAFYVPRVLGKGGSSFPQLCCGAVSVFPDQGKSHIKDSSNFNNFDLYIYMRVSYACAYMDRYVCIARQKEHMAAYTRVSFLIRY